MDISLITSLYRAEAHLAAYSRRLLAVAAEVKQSAGLALEVIVVANDVTPRERAQIEQLTAQAEAAGTLHVVPLYVPRETIYATWNRGIEAASGRCVGFWNADDVRSAAALAEGTRLIAKGCALVEFPFDVIQARQLFGRVPIRQRRTHPPQYQPQNLTLKTRLSPFFMFARALIETAGTFDANFRIAGDFEWCARPAVRAARVCYGTHAGGTFFLHGANLSGSHNPREAVEDAIVLLRHNLWEHLRPVDPELLRESWDQWGSGGIELPADLADRLWGEHAAERWEQWLQRRRRARRSEQLRAIPRWLIDRTRTRPFLARLGIVKPNAQRHS